MEARIISERIEHRIEPEQRRSERHAPAQGTLVRYGQEFLQSGHGAVGFSCLRRHPGEKLDRTGTIYRVFVDRVESVFSFITWFLLSLLRQICQERVMRWW